MEKKTYHDLEDMVNRMQLTFNEVFDVLDMKNFTSERTGWTLPPGIYEISDINRTLQVLLPDIVKLSISIDDIRLKSNLNINQTLIFTKRSFFYIILGLSQSNLGLLGDIEGYIQLIPRKYKSIKPINITATDKVHLNVIALMVA